MNPVPENTRPSALPPVVDNTLLGNALAAGARLVEAGRIPESVLREDSGAYALCLLVKDGDAIVRTLAAGESVDVGREAEWPVDDGWMSRRHFRIFIAPDGTPAIADLGARNGTFVNDKAVEGTRTLLRGDVIRAGKTVFLFL